MAVATAIYAVYAGRQWSAINKQLPELHTSAEATKSAAETAAAQLEFAERPWVDAKSRSMGLCPSTSMELISP
jgi:flagellar biosynthesis chaperone FliJ